MTASTPLDTLCKFTPDQCLRLGKVYAMILRWNREDDLLREKQPSFSVAPSIAVPDSAAFAETINKE